MALDDYKAKHPVIGYPASLVALGPKGDNLVGERLEQATGLGGRD